MTIALAIPPLTVKNRGVLLFVTVRLIERIRYMNIAAGAVQTETAS